MVRGIEKFREYFKDFPDNYVIIGGTACDLKISDSGFMPWATKDIDIVLVIEALSKEFVKLFWKFISDGNYGIRQKSMEERKHYRFTNPEFLEFPQTIELFSKIPDMIDLREGSHLTPIPVGEDLSSLSAILMNDDYYNYTIEHCTPYDGIQSANAEALICLKAKAYLDLTERKDKGNHVDKSDINKHKNDIFRIGLTFSSDKYFDLPPSLMFDLKNFTDKIKDNLPDETIFKNMGAGNIEPKEVLNQIINVFKLSSIIIIESEIESLKRNQKPKKSIMSKTPELVKNTIQNVYIPFLKEVNKGLSKFNDLYKNHAWYFFEEPQAPKYKIPLMPIDIGFDKMLDIFNKIAQKGEDSYHNFKASYWLTEYNDEHDFSIEVAFKIWLLKDNYSIEVFIGRPFQSSLLAGSILNVVDALQNDDKKKGGPFSVFAKYSTAEIKYDEKISKVQIDKWTEDINKQLLDVIKRKVSSNKQ